MAFKKKRQNGEETHINENGDDVQAFPQYDLPANYKEKSSDLIGFWNPAKGPVHFVPRFARSFDSNLESNKTSIIIMGQAIDAMVLSNKEHDDVQCKAGDMIGVWYKPGMNAIKDLADVAVFMFPSGHQQTGKPNPMVTFKIAHQKDGNPLLITDDFRKKSLHTSLPFPLKNKPKNSAPVADDDENFDGGDTSFP
jgi:hypothetical protein